MSGAQGSTRIRYADFLTERIHEGLNFNRNHRFFLIYGKNTSDEFLTKSMLRASLRETLWATLQANAFELVVFYNVKEKLFFLDERSYRNSKEIGALHSQASGRRRPTSSKMQPGPLGKRSVLRPQPPAEPQRPLPPERRPSAMADPAAMTNMDDLVRNREFRTALVVEDAENFFYRFEHEIKDQLATTLKGWNDMKTDNSNVVMFITSREPYDRESSETMLRIVEEFPELANLIKVATGEQRISSEGYILHVPAPYDDEVDRLISEFRLKSGVAVNWPEKNPLVRWLAAEQHSLKGLIGRFNESGKDNPISIETARRRKWISGDSDARPAHERLNELIGMQELKKQVERKTYALRAQLKQLARDPNASTEPMNLHIVLTGNPGTGKTTAARLIGEIYRDLGLMRRGHTIEARRENLVAEHVGGSAPKTNALINSALDGVLFIDEAYQLRQKSEDVFGDEAITTLLARMENDRHRLAVIVAGYEKEMVTFINSNPGLTSRFSRDNFIHIEDYSPQELFQICELMISRRGFTMNEEMRATIQNLMQGMYDSRQSERFTDPETGRSNYGNAREVRNLIAAISTRQAYRLRGEHSSKLSVEDIPEDFMSFANLAEDMAKSLDELLDELDTLVGMQAVKEVVAGLIDDYRVSLVWSDQSTEAATRHMIFTGNPGTGKTTVAKLVGKMLKSLGILKSGHLVPVTRGDLVAEYEGQTAPKTREVINRALNGILLIDEAYDLAHDDRDSFGKEAIAELVTSLENYRDRLIVILAGYTKEMQALVNTNPGIRSRIGHTIEFPDYDGDEMLEIFLRMAARARFEVTEDVRDELHRQFRLMYERRDRNFGNARDVRVMFFDKMTSKFNGRVAQAIRNKQDPKSVPRAFLLSDVPGASAKQSYSFK